MGAALPKQFLLLSGVPVLLHTLRAFAASPCIDEIILVVPVSHRQQGRQLVTGLARPCRVVVGGSSRQQSVWNGLTAVSVDIDTVAVHDGARPLVSPRLIERTVAAARRHGAAIAALPAKDTLKLVEEDGVIRRTVDRSSIWQAQTPQAVRLELLREAYEVCRADGVVGTDEASLLEHAGIAGTVVQGEEQNIKITRPDELAMAGAILGSGAGGMRIGHGYDAHRLVPDRKLVLGGVTVPHDRGLQGHSDADVLTHALCDALLGALGRGDIGRHFPDHDARYQGICSLKLLEEVMAMVGRAGYGLANADVTVVAQAPKLSGHFPAMRDNLARVCAVDAARINLKGTTTEKMGFAGRQEGISAHAVVLLEPAGADLL